MHDASIGIGPKHGILILGTANAGKTRLAFEALTQTLPGWKVLLWNAANDSPSKVPAITGSKGRGFVIFIDDLQEYVPFQSHDGEVLISIPDNRIATLQAFLDNAHRKKRLIVVATCRSEDETRVGARLRWLFDQLKVITLPNFQVNIINPESARIIHLFQQHGATEINDWDGTLGSLVLGLSKKQSQYEDLVQSHHPAVLVLRAMKLLSLASIPVHSQSRIQNICVSIFGEPTFQENTKIWQDIVDRLSQLQFITEGKEKDRANGSLALVIRKDSYFDKVITDYPAPNRPYQLDQHFVQLQNVLMELSDSSALLNLANAQRQRGQYKEALTTYEQALRLNPKDAFAYIGKGNALNNLKRHEEALTAYEQALRLNSNDAFAYIGKGYALNDLKRYKEALAA